MILIKFLFATHLSPLSQVRYSCGEGWRFGGVPSNTEATVTCGIDGEWEPQQLQNCMRACENSKKIINKKPDSVAIFDSLRQT